LDNLEKAGYIQREQSEEDRRKILIKLTERTQKLQKVYINLSVEMTKLFYKGFTEEEIDDFEAMLRRILDNLIPHDSEGGTEVEDL